MYYKDNWLAWYYDGIEYGSKTSPDSTFDLKIKPTISRKVKSYKEELLINAQLIRNSFAEPFDLLLSGGVDSEVVLRCYSELKIPINVFIFKYENDYNKPDVSNALKICDNLNVVPTIIDFNLQHFFENDAYDIWKTGYYLNSGRLPHMKMIEYLDNIPIMGDCPPTWCYNNKEWKYKFSEIDFSQSVYCKTIKRTAVIDWYQFSPEVIVAHSNTNQIKQIRQQVGTNDDFTRMKYELHKSIWEDIEIRPKYVGFEGGKPPGINTSKPEFMLKFNDEFIKNQSVNIFFKEDELMRYIYN